MEYQVFPLRSFVKSSRRMKSMENPKRMEIYAGVVLAIRDTEVPVEAIGVQVADVGVPVAGAEVPVDLKTSDEAAEIGNEVERRKKNGAHPERGGDLDRRRDEADRKTDAANRRRGVADPKIGEADREIRKGEKSAAAVKIVNRALKNGHQLLQLNLHFQRELVHLLV